MAKVIWRNEALDQLDAISAYIRRFDPAAADRIVSKLIDLGESLAEFPRRGRPAPHDRREMATVPPYVLTYEESDDTVRIVDIRHGRRRRLHD